MNFNNWAERNREVFGSEYEILFALQVLPLVEGLQCEDVTAQYHFVDSDGKDRYCDFAIIESDAIRVAIEIDGYDKRGSGTGMSYDDFLDWQRRQASIASQGWHVLRFANRDVRDNPRECAKHISQLLKRLRQTQTGLVEIVTIQSKLADVTLVPSKAENIKPSEGVTTINYKLLILATLGVLVGFALWQKHAGKSVDTPVPVAVAEQFTSERPFPEGYVSDDAPPSNGPFASELAPASVAALVAQAHDNPELGEPAYGTLDCSNPLDWSVAKQHIGQIVTVIGPLLASKPRPDIKGSPMWLDVGKFYPNQDRFTVVVWGKDWAKFDAKQLDAEFWFEIIFDEMGFASICIKGKVTEYRGVPQIELQEPSQLRIAYHRKYFRP